MNTDLLSYVVTQLQARRGQWPEICRDMPVPYGTLAKIAGGFTPNPRIKTVQALADYLRALELEEAKD